jgi:hypothetical protein
LSARYWHFLLAGHGIRRNCLASAGHRVLPLAFVVLGYSVESFAGHTPAVRLINGDYWVLAVVVMILTNAAL